MAVDAKGNRILNFFEKNRVAAMVRAYVDRATAACKNGPCPRKREIDG